MKIFLAFNNTTLSEDASLTVEAEDDSMTFDDIASYNSPLLAGKEDQVRQYGILAKMG